MATLHDLQSAVAAAIRQHGTHERAAEEYGVGLKTISRILNGRSLLGLWVWRAFGLYPDPQHLDGATNKIAAAVAAWQAEGRKPYSRQIAADLGVSRTTVRRYLAAMGLGDDTGKRGVSRLVLSPKGMPSPEPVVRRRRPRGEHPWSDDVRREMRARREWWTGPLAS